MTEEVVVRREVTNRFETVRDTVRRDEVIVEQATLPAPRRQVETTQRDHKAAAPVQARKPEAAHLAADLQAAAGRFETNSDQQKALATLHETLDAPASAAAPTTPNSVKPAQPQAEAPKVTVELPKAAAPLTDAERNDKGGNRKG